MRLDEFREQMAAYRRAADEEALRLKDSYLALDRLHALYHGLDREERAMADEVLAEWVLSEDENVRFDSLSLIDDFKIRTAMPALLKLVERLARGGGPSAPYELQMVKRIMQNLKPSNGS